jgi:hypothetical protein
MNIIGLCSCGIQKAMLWSSTRRYVPLMRAEFAKWSY